MVLDRLIRYYRYLADLVSRESVETITSARLGEALDVDSSLVRKDFAAVGLVGMSRVGYEVCEVCRSIRTVVGFDRPYSGLLVGAGKLGGAILSSPEFERYGLRIAAAFDADAFKVGRRLGEHEILPMSELEDFVRDREIRLAILTVPAEAAQPLADRLARCGIEALWNFTPLRLTAPPGVLVRNERLSAGLAEIAYHLNASRPSRHRRRSPSPA
ncbi:MAG TPA: redox-sensing transcriptional repressor Rex, partial [Longimicrobiales bacterium]|nr:redox-sensing transcriptional repressor Rex [Longimicrobiales bacterium]